MSEEKLTGKQICEAYVKFKGLNMTGEQFWNSGYRGELYHVFEARAEMEAAGYPILTTSSSDSPKASNQAEPKATETPEQKDE